MAAPKRPVTATYTRDIPAKLVVRLETGEEWEAGPVDLVRFRLVRTLDAQCGVSDAMTLAGLDPSDAHSALRYAIERFVAGTPLVEIEGSEDADVIADVRHLAGLFKRGVDPDEWDHVPCVANPGSAE